MDRIQQLAATAALDLTAAELEEQRLALEKTGAYAARLAAIDTGTDNNIETGENRLREDEVTNEDHAKDFTAAAPDSSGPYFRVPRTVEE